MCNIIQHFDCDQSISNSKSRTFGARQEVTKKGGELSETFKKPSFNVKNSSRGISPRNWQALLYSAYDLSS